ncbi:MAG: hypothetical protein BroJett040_02520 [Oligoflexia bacterium]|nr:MAG: hypothetical protein BroJett040_02520 [Oligoflexia bacterium]
MNIGATELILVVVIVLLLFGPSKLPGLGKALGESIRGFKKGFQDETEKPAQLSHEENATHEKSSVKEKEKQS